MKHWKLTKKNFVMPKSETVNMVFFLLTIDVIFALMWVYAWKKLLFICIHKQAKSNVFFVSIN